MDRSKDSYYLLSPAKLPYVVNEFAEKYRDIGLESLSPRDLGQILASDYRDSRVIHRETANTSWKNSFSTAAVLSESDVICGEQLRLGECPAYREHSGEFEPFRHYR